MLCRRRVWLPVLLCVSWASVALQARAEEPPTAADASTDLARQLFNEGLGFVEHEDWADAEDRFRRVLALRSSHVVSYNLASALMHLGRLVEGSELLRAIVRDASADATTHDAATQLLSEIEPRIGTLTIRVGGDASGASLRLDDRAIELSGQVQTLAVDPGEHHVSVQRDGAQIEERNVSIGDGQPLQAELGFELPARVAPHPAALAPLAGATLPLATSVASSDDREPAASSLFSQPWFWIGAGVLVAGGVVTALALSAGPRTRAPIAGDTDPPQVHGRVQVDTP